MKLPFPLLKHRLSSQQGKVASMLALIEIGLLALIILVGSRLVERQAITGFRLQAQELSPQTPTLSCDEGEQVTTIAANHFNSAEDITPIAPKNNADNYYRYNLLDANDITEPLDNWELSYKIIPRSVNSGQWGFNTSLHTCLNSCEQSEVGEGVTHWSSVINDTSHLSHDRRHYLALVFNSLYDTNRCPYTGDGSATFCDKDDLDYYSYMFKLEQNQEYSVKLTKMGDRLGVEISDQTGNRVFTDNIPASDIPMNWIDIASWGNLSTGRGFIYNVSVNENKRLDWYVKRPDTNKDMHFELDDLIVRGCTGGPARLTFKVKLPDITSNISPIAKEEVQVEVYDGVEKFHTANVTLVKDGDYYKTQKAIAIPIAPSRQQIVSTIAVKQRVTLRRSFANVILTPGETLDCTADDMIDKEPNPCGELFSQRDEKLLLSGDSDGFNSDSGSYNKIDSADLSALALQFNTTARDEASWAVDFNIDGQVNISDLEILGRNYSKQGQED